MHLEYKQQKSEDSLSAFPEELNTPENLDWNEKQNEKGYFDNECLAVTRHIDSALIY